MGLGLNKVKERDSNIELLRIFSIFLITLSHWAIHSDFVFGTNHLVINQLLTEFVSLGELGVCIFVIISGYFSVFKNQTVKGFLNLLLKIWIYNLIVLAFTQIGGVKEIGIKDMIKYILPIYNTHWFAYTFLILYVLMPFLNIFIRGIKKEDLKKLIIILLAGWSVIYSFTGADLQFSYLGWFVLLYFIGAYIRLYSSDVSKRRYFWILMISTALLIFSTVAVNIIGLKMGFYPDHGTDLYSLHSPFIIAMAVALFCIFKKLRIKKSVLINLIASASFSIYLLSDNPLLRGWIWNRIFYNEQFSESNIILVIGIGEVLLIMLVCFFVELIWRLFSNTKFYIALTSGLERIIRALFSKMLNVMN